jgi:hypothetical protein
MEGMSQTIWAVGELVFHARCGAVEVRVAEVPTGGAAGLPLLSRDSCVFANGSGRRRLPERRFQVEVSRSPARSFCTVTRRVKAAHAKVAHVPQHKPPCVAIQVGGARRVWGLCRLLPVLR